MIGNPSDHEIAEAVTNVPKQADAFYARERMRIEREFYQSRSVKPIKQKGGYGDRLRERFAKKHAKGG